MYDSKDSAFDDESEGLNDEAEDGGCKKWNKPATVTTGSEVEMDVSGPRETQRRKT